MPRFSEYFSIRLSQHELDFVDISSDYDTPVYVDPYAIEVRDDIWSGEASAYIRSFFIEVLSALRQNEDARANHLMSHLQEPRETFLGVSRGKPKGRGVGRIQARQLITAIRNSKAYQTGLLSDLSEMSLYVEGIDRDKISDLTTNVIRSLLIEYTKRQCDLYGIPVSHYSGPPEWNIHNKNWESRYARLPYIDESAVLLVPKFIVRRRLCLDSQEFYNKQITDFLIEEHLRADSSLVYVVKKTKEKKVDKKDVREQNPMSKALVADMVRDNPHLLEVYKEIAKKSSFVMSFSDDDPSIQDVCRILASSLLDLPSGRSDADAYHKLVQAIFTVLFFPNLIQPCKEWDINDGRKRIDIVYINSGESGFFSQRRNATNTQSDLVIVECKNYSEDIANAELDQLLGRFDSNRGRLGIMACRSIDNTDLLMSRCRDMSRSSTGFIIVFTDKEILEMLEAKSRFDDGLIEGILHAKFRELLR